MFDEVNLLKLTSNFDEVKVKLVKSSMRRRTCCTFNPHTRLHSVSCLESEGDYLLSLMGHARLSKIYWVTSLYVGLWLIKRLIME